MSVTGMLKEETWALHQRAERHPLQAALVRGQLPKPHYAEHLGQMLCLHRALESLLKDLCSSDTRVAAAVHDEQFQEPYLLEDLAHFGGSAAPEPLDATARLTESISTEYATRPAFVLGAHYVLEGSNNGNRFIAKAVRPAYQLQPGTGDRYLDPYGDEQPVKWTAFKQAVDNASWTDDERQAMLDGANAMFLGMIEMFDDLAAKHGIRAPEGGGRPPGV